MLPIVTTFFLVFSVLEDSGYLPRLAVMVNRVFRAMGLNGKAVLPMVLGLGCDTMATMTTRILRPATRARHHHAAAGAGGAVLGAARRVDGDDGARVVGARRRSGCC